MYTVRTAPSTQQVFIALMVRSTGLVLMWPGLKSWLSFYSLTLTLNFSFLRMALTINSTDLIVDKVK